MKSYLTYAILRIGLLAATCRKRYADYTENSGFDRPQCDSAMLENLTVTGRVRGYVKYHHPVFAGRKFNVDYELFELLPRVADADCATRNRVLAQWIDRLEFSFDCGRHDALHQNSLGPARIRWHPSGERSAQSSWSAPGRKAHRKVRRCGCSNVMTVGSRTAGADGTVSPIDLPGGIRTGFSGLGRYYSDGREVQRNGLLIDREAEPTLEDLLAERDPALELAMQLIGKEKI